MGPAALAPGACKKPGNPFYGLPGFSLCLAARKPWRHRLPLPCRQVAQAGAAAAAGGAGRLCPQKQRLVAQRQKRRPAFGRRVPLLPAGKARGLFGPFVAPRGGCKQRGRAQGGQQRQAAPLPRMAAAAVRRHGQAHARGRVLIGAALPCPGRAGGVYRKGKRYLCACAAAGFYTMALPLTVRLGVPEPELLLPKVYWMPAP